MYVLLHGNKFSRAEGLPEGMPYEAEFLGDVVVCYSDADGVYNHIAKTVLQNNGAKFGWHGDISFCAKEGGKRVSMSEEQAERVSSVLRLVHDVPTF